MRHCLRFLSYFLKATVTAKSTDLFIFVFIFWNFYLQIILYFVVWAHVLCEDRVVNGMYLSGRYTVKCRYNAVFGVQEIDRVIAVTAL